MPTILCADNSAQSNYEYGKKYPYDTPNQEEREQSDWADWAARGVVSDLCDRRSIKWGFQEVDEDIRKEIVSSLAAIIRYSAEQERGLTPRAADWLRQRQQARLAQPANR